MAAKKAVKKTLARKSQKNAEPKKTVEADETTNDEVSAVSVDEGAEYDPFGDEDQDDSAEETDASDDVSSDEDEDDVIEDQVRAHLEREFFESGRHVEHGYFETEYETPDAFTTESHKEFMRRVVEDASNLGGVRVRPATAQRVKFNRDKTKVIYRVSIRKA